MGLNVRQDPISDAPVSRHTGTVLTLTVAVGGQYKCYKGGAASICHCFVKIKDRDVHGKLHVLRRSSCHMVSSSRHSDARLHCRSLIMEAPGLT